MGNGLDFSPRGSAVESPAIAHNPGVRRAVTHRL
jgi:hypothetical protein